MKEFENRSQEIVKTLAKNLRFFREQRQLTQQSLAKVSEIPRSTIATLESGDGNPTLSVLLKLSAALHLSLEELLMRTRSSTKIYKKGALPIKSRGPKRLAQVHKLLPDPIPGMEIDRMELATGAHIKGIPHKPGTREYLFIEKGQMTLWTSGESYSLKKGDVAVFPGDQKHSYENASAGTTIAFGVVALTPIP